MVAIVSCEVAYLVSLPLCVHEEGPKLSGVGVLHHCLGRREEGEKETSELALHEND